MLEHLLSTDDLTRIARAGGGFVTKAGHRSVDDLVRIARTASETRATITLLNLNHLSTDDLVIIARAGAGCVAFRKEDE
jgi:hypothetical protein